MSWHKHIKFDLFTTLVHCKENLHSGLFTQSPVFHAVLEGPRNRTEMLSEITDNAL